MDWLCRCPDPREHAAAEAAAADPVSGHAALTCLAAARCPLIRAGVARNPGTPMRTLNTLAADPVPEVRGCAYLSLLDAEVRLLPEPAAGVASLLATDWTGNPADLAPVAIGVLA